VDDRSDAKHAQKRRNLQFIGLAGANYWPVNDNHPQAELGLIVRSTTQKKRCQGSENKSSQKPTKIDTFLYRGKDLASKARTTQFIDQTIVKVSSATHR
jgi:hypothetical protein